MIFSDFSDFINQGKIADILVISTMDQNHYEHAMKALDVGYHILLEKPIALSKETIYEIKEKANKLKLKIAVAHVLRYTHFYESIKNLIDQNAIGDIINIHQTENVGYKHFAHSYVRGNWHNSDKSSPMILAKSSHDFDIITYLKGRRVKRISSFGNLSYFKKENAPKGAASNCIDCKVDCIFNAIEFYKENPSWMSFFTEETNVDHVFADRNLDYGKCVYKMDNNVVDHQIVNMEFEDGTTGTLTTTAFSKETHRMIEIKGTLGEIVGDLEERKIYIKPYNQNDYTIDVNQLTDDFSFHSGGDRRLFIDFVRAVRDHKHFITDINFSLESHFLAFDAESSRKQGGAVIDTSINWRYYEKND
jgi:predicted dehydrogenase